MQTEIFHGAATEVKTLVKQAQENSRALKDLLSYIKRDHIVLVQGDGEITRYIAYLARQIETETSSALHRMEEANIKDALPF